jgi:translation elongation factor EF-1beta
LILQKLSTPTKAAELRRTTANDAKNHSVRLSEQHLFVPKNRKRKRKSVEKNKAKLEAKIKKILEQVNECIAQDNNPDDEPPTPINSEELKERIAKINREKLSKEQKKAFKNLFFGKKPVVFIIFVQKQKFSSTEKYFSVQKLKLAAQKPKKKKQPF